MSSDFKSAAYRNAERYHGKPSPATHTEVGEVRGTVVKAGEQRGRTSAAHLQALPWHFAKFPATTPEVGPNRWIVKRKWRAADIQRFC